MLGIAVATPIGVMAGTYLAEYGKGSKLADLIRFINDILLSAPSILIGLFVYVILVMPFRGYSGWAGGRRPAIIALPVIVRTTRTCSAGAEPASRGGRRAGFPALHRHPADLLARRQGRHRDGHPAGAGPHRGRDRSAAVSRR